MVLEVFDLASSVRAHMAQRKDSHRDLVEEAVLEVLRPVHFDYVLEASVDQLDYILADRQDCLPRLDFVDTLVDCGHNPLGVVHMDCWDRHLDFARLIWNLD